MNSPLDELNIPASDTVVPFSSSSGMAAVPAEFESEDPAPEVDPAVAKRNKAIARLASNDRAGYAALVEAFQTRAKDVFIELASISPLDASVPVLLSRFQTLNEVVQKLKSFGS